MTIISVRFTTSIASPDWSYRVRQVVRVGTVWSQDEIPASEARGLLARGVVEPVEVREDAPPASESASVAPAAETAALPRVPRRRRGA